MNKKPAKTIAQQTNIKASKENIPLSVLAELTYRCNHRCYFCYQKKHESGEELNTMEWRSILRQLADMGALYITFSGGEPFLREDLMDIIESARHSDFAVSIITNGTYISEFMAKKLDSLGVMDVGVSLHAADAGMHDRMTEVPGSYDRAVLGIRRLVNAGVKVIIKHSVSNINFGEYKKLRNLAETEGCYFECDSIVFPQEQGTISPYSLSEEQHMTFFRDMNISQYLCVGKDDIDSMLHCDAGRSLCGITPDGDLLPCIQLPVPFGNLRRTGFRDIWNSEKSVEFRKMEKIISDECLLCESRSFCSRCHGVAYFETLNWRGKSQSLCSRASAAGKVQKIKC